MQIKENINYYFMSKGRWQDAAVVCLKSPETQLKYLWSHFIKNPKEFLYTMSILQVSYFSLKLNI